MVPRAETGVVPPSEAQTEFCGSQVCTLNSTCFAISLHPIMFRRNLAKLSALPCKSSGTSPSSPVPNSGSFGKLRYGPSDAKEPLMPSSCSDLRRHYLSYCSAGSKQQEAVGTHWFLSLFLISVFSVHLRLLQDSARTNPYSGN